MSPDFAFWLALKIGVTAALVVVAGRAAERAGSPVGAMVATLPVAAAPAYVFVALDHEANFIAMSALASLIINAANVVFCLVYTLIAQSRGLVLCLSAALGSWLALATLLGLVEWTLPGAVLFNIAVFSAALPIGQRFRNAPMPAAAPRWYDVPLRSGMVAALVAIVVASSAWAGPTVTGALALFPVVLTSMVLIFQPRIGGPAAATITANAIPGLAGYGAALVVLHLAAVPLGMPLALVFALGVSVGWNLMILRGSGRSARTRSIEPGGHSRSL